MKTTTPIRPTNEQTVEMSNKFFNNLLINIKIYIKIKIIKNVDVSTSQGLPQYKTTR